MKRTGFRRRYKPRARSGEEIAEARGWRAVVLTKARYHQSLTTEGEQIGDFLHLQAHHLIPKAACKKYGAPLYDYRNGFPISKRRHERETSKHEPVRFGELPEPVQTDLLAFLADWPALLPWAERHLEGFPVGG